ncbi:MAG: DHH family phosphoesterase [Syntrophaceae bacterium]|nr:DHH family phosphoesterase [Syntrophaceae bacterium]
MRVESVPIRKETELNFKKLMEMVQPDDSLALLMYGSPDPDAIASAMALREIVQQTKGLSRSVFVSTEPLIREQNIEFVSSMRLYIHLLNQMDLSSYRLISLLDAQPSFFHKTSNSIKPRIVLDHHPYEGEWKADLADVRPNYGALSSILTEYLLCSRVKIPRNLHTALLYGIKTDTNNFDRSIIFEDISAYTYHTKYANMQFIRRVELNETPPRFLKYYNYAYHHMNNFRGRRVCFLGEVESADVCVQIADFYLRLIGTYYVVVAGIVGNRLIIIFRGDGYRQNCGAIAQRAFGLIGQGGGHRSAARMEIPIDALRKNLESELSQRNVERFLIGSLRREPKQIFREN